MPATRPADNLAALSAGSRRRLVAGWAVGLLALAALVGVVLRRSEVEEFLRLAREADPIWLVPAVAAQAATYVCAAAVWRAVLGRAGYPRGLLSLIPLGVAKLFADQAIPSGGFSGSMLVTMALHRRRVPAHTAVAVLIVGLVSYNIAYAAAAAIGLALLDRHGRLNAALVVLVALLILFTVALPAVVLALKAWDARLRDRWLGRFRRLGPALDAIARAPTHLVKSPALLAETVAYQAAILALDMLTLWLALRAIGIGVEPWVAFASFVVASAAATIVPIPLGLGTFETGSVGMLATLGVPLEAALTATLLLRGLTFWLPMLPGLWLARREIVRRDEGTRPVS